MNGQTIEQRRAKHALDRINELRRDGGCGNYANHVKALPAAILMNGLGQAIATECAARDRAHEKLANHLASWLLSAEAHVGYPASSNADGPRDDDAQRLLRRIVEGDQSKYRRAHVEAIAYVGWLKKFAAAFLQSTGEP
jgi:CRISPR-associated protein Cmr5